MHGICGAIGTTRSFLVTPLFPSRPPRPILALYAIDIALGGLAVVVFLVRAAQGLPPVDFFRIGTESNLPTWYASSQLLLIGLLLIPLVYRDVQVQRKSTWPILLLPAFFLLLSLDEAAMLHEQVGNAIAGGYGLGADLITGPWMLVMAPLYGLLAWFTLRAAKPYLKGRPGIVALALAGGALFALSAVGLEYAANLAGAEAVQVRQVLSLFEEVGEMAGATTLLWSVTLLLAAEHIGITLPERGATSAM